MIVESQPLPFAYLSAPNARLYSAVLGVFGQARGRFTVHLRPEDVAAELHRTASGPADSADAGVPSGAVEAVSVEAASVEIVAAALEKLVEWSNLRADADTGRVTTVEDFHRACYLYQLTHWMTDRGRTHRHRRPARKPSG